MPTWVPCASNLSGQIFIIPPSAGPFLPVCFCRSVYAGLFLLVRGISRHGISRHDRRARLHLPGFMSMGRAYNDYQKLPSSIGSRHISGAPGSTAPGSIAQKTLPLLLVAGFESAWVQRRSEDNTAVRTIPQ